MNMKADYKLVGLGKPNKATLEHLDSDKQTFWATIDMPIDKIDQLWKMCKGNWDDRKIAEVKFDSLSSDGTPINAVMTGVRFKN